MSRRTIDVYYGYDREDAVLEIPTPFAGAGTWHAEIRARLLDDETNDWFFELGYNTGVGENRIGTFPVEWVRRAEITDLDGIVPPDVLARTLAQSPDGAAQSDSSPPCLAWMSSRTAGFASTTHPSPTRNGPPKSLATSTQLSRRSSSEK